jgi:hypothetical protein
MARKKPSIAKIARAATSPTTESDDPIFDKMVTFECCGCSFHVGELRPNRLFSKAFFCPNCDYYAYDDVSEGDSDVD